MSKKTAVAKKPAKKAVTAKKSVKTTTKKVVAAKKAASTTTTALPKNVKYDVPLTKAEMYNTIAEATGLSRKQVVSVFDCLGQVVQGHIRSKAIGVCTIGGLMKVEVKRKAATKARKGVNPFTGEEIMIKAKPARNVVKVKALKKLKEMVD
jgi:nucleoid DNA-binding protein